jgi:TolB-like protein/DNA-binding winged helix-turn-helix (wHTH) protein/Tfp pilus assembly protein PilF
MSSRPLSNFLKTSEGGAALSTESGFYEFGEFRFDVRRRILLHRLEPVSLTPKACEMLLVLVQSGGQIVTKDALMKAVWPNSFVEESNLTQTVFMLRKALCETPRQRYILTVPGTGYRFAAELKQISEKGGTVIEPPPGSFKREVVSVRRSVLRLWPVIIAIAIALSAALGAYIEWLRSSTRAPAPGGRLMLAVLPFDNLTGDPGEDYLTDGLTEEMITQLGRLDPQRLGVIARTSVMHYKSNREQLGRIGGELGVQYLLEGSVRRDVEKVRVTAQLIQIKDQTHLWAKEYDREPKELLVLEGEIAHEIADEIQIALGTRKPITVPGQPTLSTQTYEAYDLYLKGQYFWNKRTIEGFHRAIDYFQQAIAKDPDYARAYAGLADSYALLSGYSLAPQSEYMPKARAAALRALEIDQSLPEAHTALALIVQNYDWDWQTAEKEYRRAIELNPNYATAHHWYAEHLSWLGRFDEALLESERARQLDPLSLIIKADHGAILYFSRRYDAAIQQFQAVLDMEPNFPRAGLVVYTYIEKGLFTEAVAEVEKRRPGGYGPWTWAVQAYVYGRSGQQLQARRALEKLKDLNRRQAMDPAAILWAYVGTGDKEQVFVWLEKAYSQHSNALTTLKVDPAYDWLRDDPRFQSLLRRVGLAEESSSH